MKSVLPPELNTAAFRKQFTKEMQRFIAKVDSKYRRAVKTWDHQPAFVEVFTDTPDRITGAILTQDKIFGFVSEGTRPHIIRPRRAAALAFPGTFSAKTIPGTIDARPGSKGGATVFAKSVNHPGTKPRHIDDVIAHDSEEAFSEAVQRAIDAAVTESGHEI